MPGIFLNGEERAVGEGRTVSSLLDELGLAARGGLAVELNEAVVPRSEHASTVLRAGDRVEIVTMMAGG